MTRQEFDRLFAASQDNTEGYAATDLAEINEAVFVAVSETGCDDEMVHQIVKSAFDREFNAR